MPALTRTIGGQTLVSFAGLAFTQAAVFVYTLVAARDLGPTDFARTQVVLSVYMLLMILGKLGLDEALSYRLPAFVSGGRSPRSMVAYAIAATAVASAVLTVVVWATAGVAERTVLPIAGMAQDLRLAAPLLASLSMLYVSTFALRGLGRAHHTAFLLLWLVPSVLLAALAAFARNGLEAAEVYTVRTIAAALPTLPAILLALRPSGSSTRLDAMAWRRLHTFGFAMVATALTQFLVDNSAVLIAPHLMSARDVGTFVVATKIWGLAFLCTGPCLFVIGPAAAAAIAARDEARASALHGASSRCLMLATAVLFGPVIAFRTELVAIFGPDYAEAGALVALTGAGQVLLTATGLNAPALLARGLQRAELAVSVGIVAAFALASLPASRWAGPTGVIAALLAAQIAGNVGRLAILGRARLVGSAPRRTLALALACVAAVGIVLVAERLVPPWVATAAFVVALAGLAATPLRRIVAEDARMLWTMRAG